MRTLIPFLVMVVVSPMAHAKCAPGTASVICPPDDPPDKTMGLLFPPIDDPPPTKTGGPDPLPPPKTGGPDPIPPPRTGGPDPVPPAKAPVPPRTPTPPKTKKSGGGGAPTVR